MLNRKCHVWKTRGIGNLDMNRSWYCSVLFYYT